MVAKHWILVQLVERRAGNYAQAHLRKEDGVHTVRVYAVSIAGKQTCQNASGRGVVLEGSGLPAKAVHIEGRESGMAGL